jgi:hypothetical protein
MRVALPQASQTRTSVGNTRFRRRAQSSRWHEAGPLAISVAWSAICDAGVRQLDVHRLDVRIPDKTIAASRWSVRARGVSARRSRAAFRAGRRHVSLCPLGVKRATFDIGAVPERYPVQGLRSISEDTVLAPQFEDQA